MSMQQIMFASLASGGDFVINGSGLFDGSSGQLARTPSSAGNQDKFTVEFIFKLSLGLTNPILLGVNPTSSQADTNSFTIQLIGSGTTGYNVRVVGWGTTWLETTQELRDPAAYQSLIVACDSTNSTAANRVRMYLNGTEVTDFATRNNPTQNQNFGMNGTVPHEIGSYAGGSAFINDYVARVVSIDGLQLAPTSFGETTDDGFWSISDVSELDFTGTNSFLIEGGANVAAGYDSVLVATADRPTTTVSASSSQYTGATGTATFLADDLTVASNSSVRVNDTFTGDFSISFDGYNGGTGIGRTLLYPSSEDGTYNSAVQPGANYGSFSGNQFLIDHNDGSYYSNGASLTASLGATYGVRVTVTRKGSVLSIYYDGAFKAVFANGYSGTLRLVHGGANATATINTVNWTDWSATGLPNDFTKTGTITATNDSPTNGGDDNEYGNYATFNPLIPDTNAGTPVYTDGNRHFANASGTGYCGASTLAINSGKFYVEIKPNTFVNDEEIIGFALASSNVWGSTAQLGNASGQGAGLHTLSTSDTKLKIDGGSLTTVDTKMLSPDRTIIAIDSEAGKGWLGFYDNSGSVSRWVDTSGTTRTTDQPAAGTNATWTFTANEAVLVGSSLYGDGNTDIYADSGDWLGTPPSGFVSMGTQNLPTPAPINYEDEYYIEAGISHSNGSTTAVTLPKTVSGGAMVRIKRTDSTGSWYGFDTVRGANKSVRWDVTEAESTSTFDDQNLTGTTFTMPSDLATGTYLLECFYVGSYFQIKGFVGDHPTVQTLSYDSALDSAPGFMVFFNRDGSTQERTMTYHISTGNASRLDVTDHATAASNAGAFGSFTPTTTQFKVGNEQNSNQDSANIISYHWANSGPYAFGSYTGNGNTDGPVSNVGGGSQFLFRKNSGAATFWSTTSPQLNGNEVNSALDLSGTQALTADAVSQMDFLSTGFKTRDNGSEVHLNNSGATYIYGAFGIQPLTDGAINQGRAK